MNNDSRDKRPCTTMSDSAPLPSPTPFPSDPLPSLTSTQALINAIATQHPSSLNNDDGEIEHGPPIAAIAGAGAAAVMLIVAVAIWYIIRRRRRQQQQQQSKSNAVSPSSSSSSSSTPSKPRVQQHNHSPDLEKQLDFTPPPAATNDDPSILPTTSDDTINNQQTSSPVLYSSPTNNSNIPQDDATVRAKKKASQQSMRQQKGRSPSIQSQASARTNVSGAIVIDMEAPTPPVPPRHESMQAASGLQKQLETISTVKDPLSVPMPAVPPSTPASPPSSDVHIDMVSLDLEKLMPIVISEELQLPGEERPKTTPTTLATTPTTDDTAPPAASQQVPVEPPTPVPPPQPVHFANEVIPTPVPRRPSMMSRKSTDSVRSRVGSACHPPPPPPPSIPLPAPPMACPGGMDQRGRRSTASSNRGSTPSRRSISLEPAMRWAREGGSDSNNTTARNSQDSFSRGYSTPSSPPSSVTSSSSSPASQQHARMPSRSRHQRCPSQVLGTQFGASPEQDPTSPPAQHRRPLSPPLAPLAVQIPRTSSRSIHAYFGGPQQQPTFTAPAQPESPTIGSFETPVVSPIAELPSSIARRTSSLRPNYLSPTGSYLSPSQRSRNRSVSQSSSEIQRISLPGTTGMCSLPPVPSLPSMLGDHLPPPPPSHSFLLRRYPSLLQHRPSSASPNSMDQDFSSDRRNDDDDDADSIRRKRQSMSVDSAGRWMSSQHGSSCSVSPVPGSTSGHDYHAEDSDPLARQDQEVQAIIADAIAIAQAKSAAVQAARQSTWYRQYQQQQQMMMQMQIQQQQQQLQRLQKTVGGGDGMNNGSYTKAGSVNTSPWTPSESHFMEEKTTVSACTSRSSSPFYSSLD